MGAEDLPLSRQFWVFCGGFISPGSGNTRFWRRSRTRKSAPCVRLRRQNRELAYVNGKNKFTGVDSGRGGVVGFGDF